MTYIHVLYYIAAMRTYVSIASLFTPLFQYDFVG